MLAYLQRAPTARRIDIIQLPCKGSKDVRSPKRLDLGFDPKCLSNHALVDLALQGQRTHVVYPSTRVVAKE